MKGIIQMIPCKADELIFLLDLMKNNKITCSMEMNLRKVSDPFAYFADELVEAKYEEGGDTDYVVLTTGSFEWNLPLGEFQFGKEVSNSQIFLFAGSDDCALWLNSSAIPHHLIEDARAYKPLSDDLIPTESDTAPETHLFEERLSETLDTDPGFIFGAECRNIVKNAIEGNLPDTNVDEFVAPLVNEFLSRSYFHNADLYQVLIEKFAEVYETARERYENVLRYGEAHRLNTGEAELGDKLEYLFGQLAKGWTVSEFLKIPNGDYSVVLCPKKEGWV